jgi:hypothetical protein
LRVIVRYDTDSAADPNTAEGDAPITDVPGSIVRGRQSSSPTASFRQVPQGPR